MIDPLRPGAAWYGPDTGDRGRSYASGLADRTPARAAPTATGIRIASPDDETQSTLDYFFRRELIEFFAAHPEQIAEHFRARASPGAAVAACNRPAFSRIASGWRP